jgi:ABC-2 type transport system permease protein
MRALLALTLANIRSYVRDRAALFWTLAFPLVFIVMFGLIFSAGGSRLTLAVVRDDTSPAADSFMKALEDQAGVDLKIYDEDDARGVMNHGDVDGIVIIPQGYGLALSAASAGTGSPASLRVITDASRPQQAGSVFQAVGNVLGVVNLGGRPPLVVPAPETVQTENLNGISYFVPTMLGLSVMQVGIFAAIPLVADREKLILKRLAATPLRRWQLVGSNVLMRLLIALAQTAIIVAVGTQAFGVSIVGSLLMTLGFVMLGAMTFLALGYVIASFASTEDSANAMTSIIQFPMMFLSGSFFQINQMPDFLQGIARVIPLTYLSDALRQVMVGGAAFAPLWMCALILVAWLAVCFGIAAAKFRWQ